MDKALPQTKLSRANVVGKAIVKIGIVKGKYYLSNKDKSQTHEEIADIIFNALGELKGVSVKIAQHIALGMPFLPPEYLEKISESFNSMPSINKALVRKIIKTELGNYPQELFDNFNMNAFAAASLGQVHQAQSENRKLAVKVQYPGIKQSIYTDMTLVHFALKRFAKGQNIDHIISEIQERLFEEVDYLLEAQNYDFFKKNLTNKNIIVPDVSPNLTTSKVITTSFLEGLSFQDYLATNPSQQEKDYYAQLIFDNYFESLYKLKMIHADPNPGNFLFLSDGKLGLIDFGCIKKIDEKFLSSYTALHIDLFNEVEDEILVQHYHELGMIEEDTLEKMLHFYQEVIKPLDRLYIEPLQNKSYDFGVYNNFSKKGFELIFEVQKKQFNSVHQVNEDYLFLDRTLIGYYALFEKMGAKIETKKVKKLMFEYTKGE